MQFIEDAVPIVKYQGLNTAKAVDFSGAPTCALPAATTIGGSSVVELGFVTSTSANALGAGPNGTTNPTFNVDSSASSCATGVNIVGAAAAGGVAIVALSSATDEGISLDAKGAGVVNIGKNSTGFVKLARGSKKSVIFGNTLTTLSAQNITPTSAQLLGGLVEHVSATGAGTATLPTGSALTSAIGTVAVGDTFEVLFANTGNQTSTITGATGSTVIGTAAVPTGVNARLRFYNTGTNTWNVYVTVSA